MDKISLILWDVGLFLLIIKNWDYIFIINIKFGLLMFRVLVEIIYWVIKNKFMKISKC